LVGGLFLQMWGALWGIVEWCFVEGVVRGGVCGRLCWVGGGDFLVVKLIFWLDGVCD